jgi:translation initiation factor IF-2
VTTGTGSGMVSVSDSLAHGRRSPHDQSATGGRRGAARAHRGARRPRPRDGVLSTREQTDRRALRPDDGAGVAGPPHRHPAPTGPDGGRLRVQHQPAGLGPALHPGRRRPVAPGARSRGAAGGRRRPGGGGAAGGVPGGGADGRHDGGAAGRVGRGLGGVRGAGGGWSRAARPRSN